MAHINQSQVKLWRRCQRQWWYRYDQKLIPKVRDRPMHIGSWLHACLEWHYRVGDWRVGHDQYVEDYNKLFEEERRSLDGKSGEPLPQQIERIMAGYLFRYQDDGWKVLAVEKDWRSPVRFRNGDGTLNEILLGGKVDLVIEDRDGLVWVVDTKSTQKIPVLASFHAMDPQLILYPWGLQRDHEWAEVLQGRPIAGVIFNYARSKPPTVPKLNKDRTISKVAIVTDYLTGMKFLADNNLNPDDFSEWLDGLRASEEMLVRYKMPISAVATKRVVYETLRTARSILDHSDVVRNVTRDCDRCPYRTICRAELFGMDSTFAREHDFTIETDETETQEGIDFGDDSDE